MKKMGHRGTKRTYWVYRRDIEGYKGRRNAHTGLKGYSCGGSLLGHVDSTLRVDKSKLSGFRSRLGKTPCSDTSVNRLFYRLTILNDRYTGYILNNT